MTAGSQTQALSEQARQLLDELKALGPIPEPEKLGKFPLDEACLQRYLRARQMNVKKAAYMLHKTLAWRESFDVASLSKDMFHKDLGTGRMYVAGNDPEGRAILVTRKRADSITAGEHEAYLKFLVYSLETCVQAMQNGQESWVWLMDMKGYSRANSPPLSVSMKTLNILADHNPERLNRCFFIDAPSVFSYLFAALSPFIDKVTRQKITFINTQDYAAEISQYNAASSPEEKAAVAKALRTADTARAFLNYIAPYCDAYDRDKYEQLIDMVWNNITNK